LPTQDLPVAGLDPAHHGFVASQVSWETWMPGTSPAEGRWTNLARNAGVALVYAVSAVAPRRSAAGLSGRLRERRRQQRVAIASALQRVQVQGDRRAWPQRGYRGFSLSFLDLSKSAADHVSNRLGDIVFISCYGYPRRRPQPAESLRRADERACRYARGWTDRSVAARNEPRAFSPPEPLCRRSFCPH